MHPLLVATLAPLLAASGLIAPGITLDDPTVQDTEDGFDSDVHVEASATDETSLHAGAATSTVPDQTTISLLAGASLPNTNPPLSPGIDPDASEETTVEHDAPLSDEDEASQEASATPVPLPEPKDAIIPAGLAVLGATAYAAIRWRYLIPGLIPLYTRIRDDKLLENETRKRLVDIIEEDPGLSQQELCDAVDAGWGNTTYHLQRLEQAGFVRSKKQGHHRRFYRQGTVENQDIDALGVLKNDNAHKIARYLIQDPGAKQKDVCEALDISPSLAHKWIKRLEENELLESKREWRSKHYTPRERLEHLVEAA